MRRPLLTLAAAWLSIAATCPPPRPPRPPGPAPTSTLTVTVLREASGLPLAGARVHVLDGVDRGRDGITDAQGRVVLASLRHGGFTTCAEKDLFVQRCEGMNFTQDRALTIPLVLQPLPPEPPNKGRPGTVRFQGTVATDDAGPFTPLGATMFWGPWAYDHDRGKLDGDLALLADAGFDYIRVLGAVGWRGPNVAADSWFDRTIDPRPESYGDLVANFTDHVYDRYGIRVQWTIFGGVETTPTPLDRQRTVDRVADALHNRRHKVFLVEIANESFQNGFGGPEGIAELRFLAARFKQRTPGVAVALSAPPGEENGPCALYAGAVADLATLHYDRNVSLADSWWRPVRQPWGYPTEYEIPCPGRLPKAVANNEPIGPQSSVAEDGDRLRLSMAFVTTFVASNSAYVLHSGAGVRGGGEADRLRGRAPSFEAMHGRAELFAALRNARLLLPPDVAGWTRVNGHWDNSPIDWRPAFARDDLVRTYTAVNGDRWLASVIGLKRSTDVISRVTGTLQVIDAPTGSILDEISVTAGQTFRVHARPNPDWDGLVIRLK